jgi:hypothetical protein
MQHNKRYAANTCLGIFAPLFLWLNSDDVVLKKERKRGTGLPQKMAANSANLG